MTLVRTLMITALLIASASAVQAGETATPAPLSADALAEILLTPGGECDAEAAAPALDGQEAEPQSQYCGPCSSSNCVGAPRGQVCNLGGVEGGWGNCNIYNGADFCPGGGGWECTCASGPLE